MKQFKQLLYIVLCVFFIIISQQIFFAPAAYAADYNVNYSVSYTVNNNGATLVDYSIKLTNLNDNLYAASQSLTVTQTDLSNISVISASGVRQSYSLTKYNNATGINTTFSNPAIGQGSYDQWDIIYTTHQVATASGGAWNILVPGFGDKSSLNISNIIITITVPTTFGALNYASPIPNSLNSSNGSTTYTFTSDQINTSGISMIIGNTENYSFSFSYPITNSNNGTQYTIAVPPDTGSQHISFTSISPKPSSFSIDNDGNYVLTYNISSNSIHAITVAGIAQVLAQNNILTNKRQTPIPLSSAQQSAYTASMKYWETTNPQIHNLALTLTKGVTTPVDKAKAIYNYLVKSFKYNKNAVFDKNRQRKGALYAIEHKDDVICQEYVDTFVALARSVGIPAVFDAGYGNTSSPFDQLPPNVLHAWAEFYDPSYGWIPVDPTWASTSGLNFFGIIGTSHFLLAQYGHQSDSPVLVSAFTTAPNQNNIKMSPYTENFTDTPAIMLGNTTMHIQGGIPSEGIITATNTGDRVLFFKNASVSISKTTFPADFNHSDQYIFPSLQGGIDFPIIQGNLLTNENTHAQVFVNYATFAGSSTAKDTQLIPYIIQPAWFIQLIPLFAVLLIFVISYMLVSLTIRVYGRFAKE